jgi:PleD family two-component response regulator
VVEHRAPDAWRDLLDRADAALARAKRAGRNRCEVA